MARNKLNDLRDHLFAALEGLADKDEPMEIERANAIAHVAGVIVQSAKVEVDYAKALGKVTPMSNFMDSKQIEG